VYYIEVGFLDRVTDDVMLASLDVGLSQAVEKPRVDISDDDLPVWADALAQPPGDRSGAAAYLEAAPARRYAKRVEVPKSPGIK
jgi:hypothetical protein